MDDIDCWALNPIGRDVPKDPKAGAAELNVEPNGLVGMPKGDAAAEDAPKPPPNPVWPKPLPVLPNGDAPKGLGLDIPKPTAALLLGLKPNAPAELAPNGLLPNIPPKGPFSQRQYVGNKHPVPTPRRARQFDVKASCSLQHYLTTPILWGLQPKIPVSHFGEEEI